MNPTLQDPFDRLGTLVRDAQSGCGSAVESLVESYHGLAARIAGRYFLPGQDREDLLQEALIGLVQGLRDYDRRRDPSLENHLSRCVRNHVLAALRRATRKRACPARLLCSLEGLPACAATCLPSAEDAAMGRLVLRDVVHAMGRLTPQERCVVRASMAGYSSDEVGRLTGLTPKQVETSLYRARRKLRAC